MKITKQKLKQIIKEELQKALKEQEGLFDDPEMEGNWCADRTRENQPVPGMKGFYCQKGQAVRMGEAPTIGDPHAERHAGGKARRAGQIGGDRRTGAQAPAAAQRISTAIEMLMGGNTKALTQHLKSAYGENAAEAIKRYGGEQIVDRAFRRAAGAAIAAAEYADLDFRRRSGRGPRGN